MEEIAKLFIELLKTHNRASLPGLGAFVASPQPAVIDKGKIIPPTKKVAFIKSETWNDGLLEQLYAKRYGVDVEVARERLHHAIAAIRFELDATGKVTLPGLGTLRQTASRDVSFGLAKNLNLQKDSYGLGEVKIASKAPETPERTRNGRKVSIGKVSIGKISNVSLFIFFCILLAIIATLTLYLVLSRVHSKDDIEALIKADEPQPALLDAPPEQAVRNAYLNASETPAMLEASASAPAAAVLPLQPAAPRCEFCTVVASFNTREGARLKAQSYIDMGYKARVVDGDNSRFRVMLGCYPTLDAAKRGLSEALKFADDAWVLEVCN
jgi:hypothetical protein